MNPNRTAAAAFLERLAKQQARLAARGRGFKTVDQLTPAQFNRRIRAQMPPQVDELPLADQLLRNDRTRALVNNRLDRLTPEQQMRSLPAISRAYEDFQRQQRRASEQARLAAQDKRIVGGLAGSTAALLAGAGLSKLMPQEEEPMPDDATTLEDIAWLAESPEDILPESIDLGEPMPIEPEVYIDAEDFDTDGLLDMLTAGQETPVLPDIADLLSADEEPLLFDMPEASVAEAMPEEELTLTRDAAPMQTPDRDPYMTNAQKRTVQVLMEAGIPSQRAGRIVLGQASLSPEEERLITGGRR